MNVHFNGYGLSHWDTKSEIIGRVSRGESKGKMEIARRNEGKVIANTGAINL